MKYIPEIKLIRENSGEKPFKFASTEIGFRNKIGGIPDGIKESEFPDCPDCRKKMTFYGQLDSINDNIIIADCGLIAVFICLDCNETKAEIVSG